MINVIGDVGLVIGAFLLFTRPARSTTPSIFEQVAAGRSRTTTATLVAACLLLLVGAFAKSAQVPLHTWLPDAMEGPTPVSVADPRRDDGHRRRLPDRAHAPAVRAGARPPPTSRAIIGTLTLFVAATIALVVTDLKRVIAYSTMSQIGYMILGVSVGAYARGHVPPDDARLLQGAAVHGAPAR